MKIVPLLAVTNALALALALYLFVKLDDVSSKVTGRRSDSSPRSDTRDLDVDDLRARIAELERVRPLAAPERDAPAPAPGTGTSTRPSHEGEPTDAPPLAAPGTDAPGDVATGGGATEFDPQEMEVFRKKVKKAIDLNDIEEQKIRVIERVDQLVKDGKISSLTPRQKDGIATTVITYRKRMPEVWQKLRESGQLDNASREDRGRIVRSEMEALRADAQRSLEEFMPAGDAKTYLDETLRESMRGFGQVGFGGRDGTGGPPPTPPSSGSR